MADSQSTRITRDDITAELEGSTIVFPYEHRYRVVTVTRVWRSKAGDQLITGNDHDRDDSPRTFRTDRIPHQHTIKKVPT